ncbi:response regulator [Paenibacillus kobensis]|uniref:response regulator n=1 Tax=Paenibacillus kobensis TaxID=59841 RepID=UPI000FD71256|nr:response regulator [Paenibacillus kobensis]
MLRLLIVDDEEIITNGLYEVFRRLMPERLDVCKAYSAREALDWMSRTRIDIVMTDIAMPGMNGLELSEQIISNWPRCRVILLTGHNDFNYAYRAIQIPKVRYLLKTEGYGKVTETVQDVLEDIHLGNLESRILEQSREQLHAYQWLAQGDYMRQLLQESRARCSGMDVLIQDFHNLKIPLDPNRSVILILGRLKFPEGLSSTDRNGLFASISGTWDSFLSDKATCIGIVDKYEDMIWFLQPLQAEGEGEADSFTRYLEGTLELFQEECYETVGLSIGLTISSTCCGWKDVTQQYEALRQLQQFKIGEGISIIKHGCSFAPDGISGKEGFASVQRIDIMAAHLESGRAEPFLQQLNEMTNVALGEPDHVQLAIEMYYSIALMLYSCVNRMGLQGRIDEYGKVLRLDDHPSMKDGFMYLRRLAESIFHFKQMNDRDRTSLVIDRICQFVEDHLSEDLSLVRLAESHYFNPSYLSRFFKQEKGINLSDYIDKCKVRKAKELLRDGELKVRDVACAVGYEAAHSFTRFFKKVTGMTPQEYRDTLPLKG